MPWEYREGAFMKVEAQANARPHVVIVGGGFGGLTTAKALARLPFEVTLIDRNNHHLFQPLLYQVATAGLSPADIASPIRSVLRGQANARVVLAEVTGVDTRARHVIADSRRIGYDYLILATGARHAYFGRDEWSAFAPGLKTVDDATLIRRRILLAFEKAETESDPLVRRALMTFVIVGGGPTGVEMAGAIAELAKRALVSDFRQIDPRSARVVLVEAAPRLLTSFDPALSEKARRALAALGVEIRLSAPVRDCSCEGATVAGEFVFARTIIWAAGVMASPAGEWLGVQTDRAGRVKVEGDLGVPGLPNVFAIGDTASVQGPGMSPLPGIAPVAKQQGQYVARLLAARLRGQAIEPFQYRDYGSLATIGRKRAVRNRFVVAMNWAWSYVTFQRGSRLITGTAATPAERDISSAVAELNLKAG
jgi:NADH:ubiquinone reductase (H+-translocating)